MMFKKGYNMKIKNNQIPAFFKFLEDKGLTVIGQVTQEIVNEFLKSQLVSKNGK